MGLEELFVYMLHGVGIELAQYITWTRVYTVAVVLPPLQANRAHNPGMHSRRF